MNDSYYKQEVKMEKQDEVLEKNEEISEAEVAKGKKRF